MSRKCILLLIIAMVSVSLSGVVVFADTQVSEKYGGTFVWAHVDEFGFRDPHTYSGGAHRFMLAPVYSTLFQYVPGGGLKNDLAVSWEVVEPGVFEVSIRQDVVFHDGTPLDIHDVIYSYNRIRNPEVGAKWYGAFVDIESLEAADDYTLRIVLKEPVSSSLFQENLAQVESAILSKSWMEARPDWDYSEHMGSGPFMWSKIEPGVQVTLVRNPKYYKVDEEGNQLPYLDQVVYKTYRDTALRMSAILTGEADYDSNPPWSAYSTYDANPNLKFDPKVGAFMGIIFNLNEPPFNNRLVRLAVAHAIDNQDIIDFAFYGYGSPVYGSPLAYEHYSLAYTPEQQDYYSYDPAKAKELLAQAGYPDGFSAKLLCSGSDKMHVDTAVVVQEALNQIGCDVELRMKEWPQYLDTLTQCDYEFAVLCELSLQRDPNWLRTSFHSAFIPDSDIPCGWNYPEMDSLLDKARVEEDIEKRRDLYRQWGELFLEECPEIFSCQRGAGSTMQGWVNDFTLFTVPKTQAGDQLELVWLDESSPRK